VVLKAEDARVDETCTVRAALRRHLEPGPGRAARLHALRRFTVPMKTQNETAAAEKTGGSGGGGSADNLDGEVEVAVFLEKEVGPER
jgi:hypothetical protein